MVDEPMLDGVGEDVTPLLGATVEETMIPLEVSATPLLEMLTGVDEDETIPVGPITIGVWVEGVAVAALAVDELVGWALPAEDEVWPVDWTAELGVVPDAAVVSTETVELVDGVSTVLGVEVAMASEVGADELVAVATEIVELVEGVSTALEVDVVVTSEMEEGVTDEAADEPEDAAPAEVDEVVPKLEGITTVGVRVEEKPV